MFGSIHHEAHSRGTTPTSCEIYQAMTLTHVYLVHFSNSLSLFGLMHFQWKGCLASFISTVEPQWLEHLWDHGNSFETWVVRATEG